MHLPLERLLIKVTEVLASGCGTVTRTWVLKREARAKALGKAEARRIERLSQEQLRQDIRDVRAGRKTIDAEFKAIEGPPKENGGRGELAEVRSDYLAATERSSMSPAGLIELERRINLDQIAALAIEEVEAEGEPAQEPDERPIDQDWLAQWRNRAQDVSSEDMQRLWARVLKGEAKASGSFNIHTMEFLSRMSRDDAELIAKLGCFAIDGNAVYSNETSLGARGLSLDALIYLMDLGLISGVGGIGSFGMTVNFNPRPEGLFAFLRLGNKGLRLRAGEPAPKELSFPAYPISVVGRELLALAACEPDLVYLKALADHLRPGIAGIDVCEAVPKEKKGRYTFRAFEPF